MKPRPQPFDVGALFRALDDARQSNGLSWAALGREIGTVSASTIRRLEHADDCEADGMLEICRWLEVPPETFVAGASTNQMLLNRAQPGVVRVADGRTSAQRLAQRALNGGVSIASLTRLSPS